MKLIIAGGRDFNDFVLLVDKCLNILKNYTPKDLEIVSGRCSTGTHTFTTSDGIQVYGADGLGEYLADLFKIKVTPFPADWSLGKKAGIIRNKQMAEYADALIAFWDGKSRGTKNMIETAKKDGLKVRVIKY